MNEQLKALLAPKQTVFELAPDVVLRIKELSLRERISWRATSVQEDGKLSEDWVAQLLVRAVLDNDGNPVWQSADEVDGSESMLGKLLEVCQQVNGLAGESAKDAGGN